MSSPAHARPPLHVLYLIDSIGVPGGAEESLAMLAPEYRKLGVELDVAFLHERPGLQAELEAAGAQLFSLAGGGGRAAWLRRARSLIRERHPDVVHTTLFEADIVGRIAARLTGTPVVSSLVNASYGPEHHANPQVKSWKLRSALVLDAATSRLATRLHAVSTLVADVMAPRLRFPRERIDVVPRGRSPDRLGIRTLDRRSAARSALGISDQQRLLVMIARQEYEKGLDVAVRAMPSVLRRYPEVRLVVAGREGSHTDSLRDLVREQGVQDEVAFLGTRRDVPELLCAADVFVLASRREGFPGSLVEAMALETPIVASDLPQVREAVDSSCAVLVGTGSVEELASGIGSVLIEPDEAQRRARKARDRFLREFTTANIAARMLDFYQRALGRNA
jgi:glycosyltransferase involved in cell wall biosynthesis